MKTNSRWVVGLLLTFLIASSSWAQVTSSISGVVTDGTGAVVGSAPVSAESPALMRGKASTVTDSAGRYLIIGLQPGVYSVRSEVAGFAPQVQEGVQVAVNTDVQVNFVLKVASSRQEVRVEAEIPNVRTQDADLQMEVDTKTIDNVPLNGRQFLDILLLQPGTAPRPTSSDQGANVTVFGERSITNSFLIDGMDNNDQYSRNFAEYFAQDAIQEFQVLVGGYQAEFGRASGAIANVLTHSGENQFHGRAFYFLRNSALDTSDIANQSAPELNRQEPGGTLGGPILKNRTFFFDAFEYFYDRAGISFNQATLPPLVKDGYFSPAENGVEPFSVPPLQNRYTEFLRLDQKITENSQLYFSLNVNRSTDSNFLPDISLAYFTPPPGSIGLPSTSADDVTNTTSASLRHTVFFSAQTFLESSFRYSNLIYTENTGKPQTAEQLFPITFNPVQIFISNAPAVGVTDQKQNRYEWSENLSHVISTASAGQHAIRFGFDLLHTDLYHRFTAPSSIILGNSILNESNYKTLGYMIDMQKFVAPPIGKDYAQATDNLLAGYVQDTWSAPRGFTINAGLRYDFSTLFSDAKNDLSPRIGVAWNVANRRSTVIRANYGRFYDQAVLEAATFTPELGGMQLGDFDSQLIPRGASFYNNPSIGAYGPLQDSGTLWLANPKFYTYILPAGAVRTNGITTITGLGQPYIVYKLLGIPVADPANPPVLTAESIPQLTGGALTPAAALQILNSFFPGPIGPQFDFLPDQGPNSIITGQVLEFKNRLLQTGIDSIQTVEHPFRTPYTDSLNVGLQQALGNDFSLDAEFFLRRGADLLVRRVINLELVPTGAGCSENTVDGGPCNRQLQYIGFLHANIFTVTLNKRLRNRYAFQLSYTHTHAVDNFSTYRVPPLGGETSFLNDNKPWLDNGRSLNTPNHVFDFNGLYQLPWKINISGVIKASSGSPFNAAGLPVSTNGDGIFDNRLYGTEKGQFQTTPFFEADTRVSKVFKFGERYIATAMIEVFNLTNRANPDVVNHTCGSSTGNGTPDAGGCKASYGFGEIIQPYDGRQIQLGFRFEF
jgi:hypothetical protein